jgi:hypothetical protein
MEQHRLFRKAALDKLASPERLDVLMQVTSPLGWLALLTMAVLLASIVAWSIFGSMSETVYGEGILVGGGLPDAGSAIEAIVFVDATAGTRIAADEPARVWPSTVNREEYGFILARVQSVSDTPVTAERFNRIVTNPSLFQDLIGPGSKLEMRTTLQADRSTASGFKWSSSSGPPFKVSSGTRVNVSVVVDRTRPIGKVLPFVRKTLGTS